MSTDSLVTTFVANRMSQDSPSLVQRAVAGDRTAQGELARTVYPRLVAMCQSRVRQRADAEELAQETLLRALRSLAQLADVSHVNAWVRGIAEHLCVDWHRSQRRGHPGGLTTRSLAADPSQAIADADEQAQLRGQIASLPLELQEVLYLHYYDELSYAEMAEWLGVARATVNERLAKARAMLRHRILSQTPAERRAGR